MSYVQHSKSRTSVKNDIKQSQVEQPRQSPLILAAASGMGGAATAALIFGGSELYKNYKKKKKPTLPKTLMQKIASHIGKISHFGTKLHGFNRAFKTPISMATNIAICASIYTFAKKQAAIYTQNRSSKIS